MKARLSLYVTAIMLVAILTVGVGCTKAPNDAQLTSDIQTKLASDSGLQGKQLGVKAEGGTVTLTGTVDNDAQRDAAARYASSEPGVKQIINNLQVAPPPPAETAEATPPPVEEAKPSPAPAPKPRRHEPRQRSLPSSSSDASSGCSRGCHDASGASGCGALYSAASAAAEEGYDSFRDNPGSAAGRYHRLGNQPAGPDLPCHARFSAGSGR